MEQEAKRLSVPKSSLENWVTASRAGKLAEVEKGQRLPTELKLELARTRQELAGVKLEPDLLKKMCGLFFEGVAVKYSRMDFLRQQHLVTAMRRVLGVSESGCHAWHQRPVAPRTADCPI